MYPFYTGDVPYLTTDQMREVDRLMIEEYKIELIQMMENAGRNLADLARNRFLGGDPRDKRVVLLAGKGGNGGGALVCARRLHNYGAQIQILIITPDDQLSPITRHQLEILRRMRVPILIEAGIEQPDLIIDGLIGYGLKDAPHGSAADLIRWANATDAPTLALDTPSGLDTTTGTVFDPTIRATATLTLALPKKGLITADAKTCVGELYVADISVPPDLYARPSLGLNVSPIFAEHDIVRLR